MKIKSAKDVALLSAKLESELNIDVSKYRNDEVTASMAELIIFPKYVLNWGIRPIIASTLVFLIGLFIIDLKGIDTLLYIIFGFPLSLFCGLMLALIFLLERMNNDIAGIMNHSLSIMKEAKEDLFEISSSISETGKTESAKLVYLGILHLVTIPSLSEAVKRKYPIIGLPLSWVLKKLMITAGNLVTIKDLSKTIENGQFEENYISQIKDEIETKETLLERILNKTTIIVQIPFKITFFIGLMLFFLLVYYLH